MEYLLKMITVFLRTRFLIRVVDSECSFISDNSEKQVPDDIQ
jgi:hypothetical protein